MRVRTDRQANFVIRHENRMILMDGMLTVGMRLLFSYFIINISIDLFKYTLNLITLSIVENESSEFCLSFLRHLKVTQKKNKPFNLLTWIRLACK